MNIYLDSAFDSMRFKGLHSALLILLTLVVPTITHIMSKEDGTGARAKTPGPGFYTKLNVWGSLGLNFDYDGGPIIENGGPIFMYI